MGFEIGSSPDNLVGIGETGGGVQNSEDDRDWSFEFWFLIFLDQPWMCSATCTIVGSSAGDVEQAKIDGLLPVFVPL
jgi:hypothetical protein